MDGLPPSVRVTLVSSVLVSAAPVMPMACEDTWARLSARLLARWSIIDFYLPPEGCSYRIAVVSMKKAYPGHAKRVMMGVWSFLRQFMYTKFVIVTDDDSTFVTGSLTSTGWRPQITAS